MGARDPQSAGLGHRPLQLPRPILEEVIRNAVAHKELKHRINEPGFVRASRTMSQIGG
jgi:hypothetical protein